MTFTEAFQSALRTQGELSDDEIKRAEFVARSVAVAMLRNASHLCVQQINEDWPNDDVSEQARQCANEIDALIQQVQGEGNGHSNY